MNFGQERNPEYASGGLPDAYGTIASELREVEALMLRELETENSFVNEVIRYGFQLGGKRLRPALVLLIGKAVSPEGTVSDNHLRVAAALEMIHTATLIHDDILDGAKVRRHLETMNLRWNSAVSVLAGDVLFTKAMQLAVVSEDIFEYRTIVEATRTTCEAELRQIGTKENYELTFDEYLELISGKTAALLSCACLLGAYFSGADLAVQDIFRRFGVKLGVAFQMIDDILDLVGQESVVGKTLGTDLLEGKSTLPLILFMQTASEKDRAEMLTLLRQKEKLGRTMPEIAEKLLRSGAIDAARQTARKTIREANELLDLPQLRSAGPALAALKSIAHYVIEREK
ncbi:MAG: polyprenyl synthetase family protein [Planctomycetaceae bacterium]|nr:polyprenyl synthetase family protein [Planctomycetaceae bacterium]